MNVTFLIGNGFDIGLGLRSRFSDFFPVYYAKSRNKPANIKMLSEKITENYDKWADFETRLGEYTNDFNVKNKSDYISQVKDFENEFIEYLKQYEEKMDFSNEGEIKAKIENGLANYYSLKNLTPVSNDAITGIYHKHRLETNTINFISFNYTDTLMKCLNIARKNISSVKTEKPYGFKIGSVVNVHGSKQYPIMGVNDEEQISNKMLASDKGFTSRIVKPTINNLIGYKNDKKAFDLIKNSTIIVVYGMSLGKTDRLWWDRIIQWLYSDSERQLVVFEYDDKYIPSTFDLLDKIDSLIELLKTYNKDDKINVEDLRGRIHLAIHKNIFEIDLMKKYRETTDEILERVSEIIA